MPGGSSGGAASDRLRDPAELIALAGRVVAVTGAGGNIGAGIAARMAAAGATVVSHTRSSPAEPITSRSGRPGLVVTSDLTDSDAARLLVDTALERYGRLDGLVNNAGIQTVAAFADLTDLEWSEMIDTNLTATHRLTQAAAAAMAAQESGGAIVHVASIEGSYPAPGHGHYSVSKAGMIMQARAAAQAYGSAGVRVNVVSPGLISRPGIEDAWPEGVGRWKKACPLGRLGTPEDIGDACVFLCSDLARWITGAELLVDGGGMSNPTW